MNRKYLSFVLLSAFSISLLQVSSSYASQENSEESKSQTIPAQWADEVDEIEFDIKTPTVGSIVNDLIHKVKPDEANVTKALVVRTAFNQGTDLIPIVGPTVRIVVGFYDSTPEDLSTREGTIARKLGGVVKDAVEHIPGGERVTKALAELKPAGAETFTEGVLASFAPVTLQQTDAEVADIIGGATKDAVQRWVPYGSYVTKAAGLLGMKVFGTETLTAGVLKVAGKLARSKAPTPFPVPIEEHELDVDDFFLIEAPGSAAPVDYTGEKDQDIKSDEKASQ